MADKPVDPWEDYTFDIDKFLYWCARVWMGRETMKRQLMANRIVSETLKKNGEQISLSDAADLIKSKIAH